VVEAQTPLITAPLSLILRQPFIPARQQRVYLPGQSAHAA
jgi:hypothetical protein